MKKMMMTLVTLVVVLLLCVLLCLRYAAGQKRERLRLENNQEALLERQREYRVRDSLNAVSVSQLEIRADEFRKGFEEMSRMVRDMGLRIRRVESLSQSATESSYEIEAVLRGTAMPREQEAGSDTREEVCGEEVLVSDKYMSYHTPHISIDGVISDNVFNGTIVTYDTLTQVVHRVPRRFLFLKWGTKELRQEIVSSNPHTRVTYSRSIRMRK